MKPPKIESSKSVRTDVTEILEKIDSLDLGNLLNEETEKSRNIFLATSTTNIFVTLFDLSSFKVLGQEVEFGTADQTIVFLVLFLISICTGISYRINYRSDFVAKAARRKLLSISLDIAIASLEKQSKDTKEAVKSQLAIDSIRRRKTKNQDLLGDSIETIGLVEKAKEPIEFVKEEFSVQFKKVEKMVGLVFWIAIVSQVTSFIFVQNREYFEENSGASRSVIGEQIILPIND